MAVIGSGLPGAILALTLARLRLKVVVLEPKSHPRFTIGESSTPTTDAYLAQIAKEFDIPELLPLSRYSSTRTSYPELTIGLKRGFSYFWHERGKQFAAGQNHEKELLVAASSSDQLSDSNWLRQEIDTLVVSWFSRYGISYLDRTRIHSIEWDSGNWRFLLHREGEPSRIRCRYFVDASGSAGLGLQTRGVPSTTDQLQTNTSALFSHFQGVKRWSQLDSLDDREHPFVCDNAAVHQLMNGGWMWQLRFDNGVTSCGIVQNQMPGLQQDPADLEQRSPRELLGHFFRKTGNYPDLARQFAEARSIIEQEGALYRRRLQHLYQQGAGRRWSALPNTIGFVDPLHSKGLAHALSGVYRMARRFRSCLMFEGPPGPGERNGGPHLDADALDAKMEILSREFHQEVLFLDRLIGLCYLSLDDFDSFRLAASWYFAAATCFEKARQADADYDTRFLLAGDTEFCQRLEQHFSWLQQSFSTGELSRDQLLSRTTQQLEQYDLVGLFAPPVHNMYSRTAAPQESEP
ncbi:MAG: hypothetical protein VX768_00315 [Planctomycetota bacterium]|nr:hypothetical protein [Planctomycetota bacterium]